MGDAIQRQQPRRMHIIYNDSNLLGCFNLYHVNRNRAIRAISACSSFIVFMSIEMRRPL